MIAHFIVSSVVGNMIAVCGEVIAPRQTAGSQVGVAEGSKLCPGCEQKVLTGWVTIRG